MLTVLIPTRNSEEALARTLASLVSGAVEGMIREVMVCDDGSLDGTEKVADHAGCVFLAGAGLPQGLARARGEWLLVLEPGSRLMAGWTDAVRDHMAGDDRPARFRRGGARRDRWLDWISAEGPLRAGLLLRHRQMAAVLDPQGALSLPRGVCRLPAEIIPAP
ncbi:glycosyltransferase [Tianweitania sediminis]|jgi:glycosyltransferase involved in cell wall biosynthesis|uniref:Glycosyltransferase n=1 Tax=Tianweitania sediminis TaxID=1502156 RepID=A0A8J7UJK0_9HYPH|nr:glycosyltransferase [Tianweitania sediminis]MBP0438749.1 glycosyltransferase [Tianweitania sediminis]HEV7417647.1 glycosyltransferase [Tianweitania sediminis]